MADYERIEAQTWKGWEGAELDLKPAKRPRAMIIYPTEQETEARSSWRKNVTPKGSIILPKEVDLQQYLNNRREPLGDALFQALPVLRDVSFENHVHIAPRTRRSKTQGITLDFWGERKNVDAAIKKTSEWIREVCESRQSKERKFVKLPNLNSDEKDQREEEFLERARAEEYRRLPPQDEHFASQGSLMWSDALGHPDKILGRSFEALDPIRINEACYIVYDSASSSFRILGNRPAKVKKALLRVRRVYFQLAAWNILGEHCCFFVPENQASSPSAIKLLPRNHAGTKKMTPVVHGNYTKPTQKDEHSRNLALDQLKTKILGVLSRLVYFRGHLSMRIRLGEFLLTTYQDKSRDDWVFTKSEFQHMMSQPRVRGEVTEECYKAAGAHAVMHKLNRSGHLLKPLSSSCSSAQPDTGEPVYLAAFTVQKETEFYMFETEFHGTTKHQLACVSQKWSKITADTGEAHCLLGASLFDVQRAKSLSWHFEIVSGQPMNPDTLAALQKFSNTVTLDVDPEFLSKNTNIWPSKPLFLFKTSPGTNLKSLEEKIVFRYRLKDSDYIVDVARTRRFTYEGLVAAPTPTLDKMFLALHVNRKLWSDNFDQNSNLGVGEGVRWGSETPSFPAHPEWENQLKLQAYADTFFTAHGLVEATDGECDGFVALVDSLNEILTASGILTEANLLY